MPIMLLHWFQAPSGLFIKLTSGDLSTQVKQPGHEAGHSPQSTAEVRNG